MLKKTSIAVILALFIVLSLSGLYYDRNVYRYENGKPKDDFVDNFINNSVDAGNNFIGGVSSAMMTIQDVFGFVRKIPIVKELVIVDESKDWNKVEVYELDYRKAANRNKTDLDVLPPEDYLTVGDELIVRIYCADYDIWHPERKFYRIWKYNENGLWSDNRCYIQAMYKREILGIIGKEVRKADKGKFLGMCPQGYVEYEAIKWRFGK